MNFLAYNNVQNAQYRLTTADYDVDDSGDSALKRRHSHHRLHNRQRMHHLVRKTLSFVKCSLLTVIQPERQ